MSQPASLPFQSHQAECLLAVIFKKLILCAVDLKIPYTSWSGLTRISKWKVDVSQKHSPPSLFPCLLIALAPKKGKKDNKHRQQQKPTECNNLSLSHRVYIVG